MHARIFLLISLIAYPLTEAQAASKCPDTFDLSLELCNSYEKELNNLKNTKSLSCKPYKQTTKYTCGPAVVMALLHYYKALPNCDMTKEKEMAIHHQMGGTKEGTTPTQVSSWLSSNGFKIEEGRYVDTQKIIQYLKEDIPVIVSTGDHWILATGYNEAGAHTFRNEAEIIFTDPATGSQITLAKNQIDSLWEEGMVGKKVCVSGPGYYIAAMPIREKE